MNKTIQRKVSPWCWIPTLYIAEGLPYFAVNTLTVLIYTQLGISKTEMAFYTGWLYLPWVIKPFWSPFVDLVGTKRGWTILMQWIMAVCFASIAFLLPTSFFFASTLAVFWLLAFASATHDIAADGYYMIELTPHLQSAFVGVRSTFYRIASLIGQGGLVILAGWLERTYGNIAAAWSGVFGILAVFFAAVAIWHIFFMPRNANDRATSNDTARGILAGFGRTFVTFFRKPHILSAILFMLLYRLPEALCIKLIQPFLIDPRANGGLQLTTSQLGFVNGTVGVIALLLGGILGGLAIARGGLKKWLWPMALSLTLPCFFYCLLAIFQPEGIAWISTAVFIEQFGYGFGFTAFMLYLIYFSQGESQTSHYAFCTAFMALGMMLPGMAAGWIFDRLNSLDLFGMGTGAGYVHFFWLVMICCLFTFIACRLVHIDPSFGKKESK